ncbi:MAG: RrF2 family transcriptional regulator [Beduini sp.]|uniref:RrF2 family transcriptional regulator n=1 Tax=Beduini sp. TaxID=1922300 RepID=UPI0039A037F3
MRLSTKVRYGLRSLIALAQEKGELLSISVIASEQELSQNYLENIFAELKKAGIIESVKGAKGGYRLIVDPNEISIVDIMEMLDHEIHVGGNKKHDVLNDIINQCVYERLDKELYTYLKSITLAQIAEEDIENISLF